MSGAKRSAPPHVVEMPAPARRRETKYCSREGCGRHAYVGVHVRGNPAYTHDYEAPRPRKARLCEACATGRHDGPKTERFGCIGLVGKGEGAYCCNCVDCAATAVTDAPRRSRGRSESEGVTPCRF